MAKNPASGTASKGEMDEYFKARDRELTKRALARGKDPSAEPPIRAKPIEFVEMFNSDSLEKDYGGYKISYENGRGFKRKAAGSTTWDKASPDEIRIFRADVKAAAAQSPKIARYIANDPEFR
jgi:hypothetical protein